MHRRRHQTLGARPLGTVKVAACVVRDGEGRILLAQRRADQLSGGYWEVPGGKIEPGETSPAATIRELFEETGLSATRVKWLSSFSHRFATGLIALDVFEAEDWTGTPKGRENQNLKWVDPARPQVAPVLPSNQKILNLLTLPERVLCVAPPRVDTSAWVDASLKAAFEVDAGALMLTGGTLTYSQHATLTRRLAQKALRYGITVWQSGTSAQPVPIRIVTNPSTIPHTVGSNQIIGLMTNDPASLMANQRPQADLIVFPFSNAPTDLRAKFGALAEAVATPIYAIVSADPAQQVAALASGAAGLLIDTQGSLSGFDRDARTGRKAALSC